MTQQTYNIGWDLTGNIGSPKKTSLKRLFEYKLGDKAQQVWKERLNRFGQMYMETYKKHGEDKALIDFYSFMTEMNITKKDFQVVSHMLFDEGLIRNQVIEAMVDLKQTGARHILVSKNLTGELEAFAKDVNNRSGLEVISGVVGATGIYNSHGTLTDIQQIIGDYTGDLEGISRVQKKTAVKSQIHNEPLAGYVTDSGDKNIREMAATAVIIKSSVPYAELDEYFQLSADKKTGNYQKKSIEDLDKNAVVEAGSNLRKDLVRVLRK